MRVFTFDMNILRACVNDHGELEINLPDLAVPPLVSREAIHDLKAAGFSQRDIDNAIDAAYGALQDAALSAHLKRAML